jgi:hypothetical protein
MDKDIEDFLRQAAGIRMSPEETARIREKMVRKMEADEVRVGTEACPTDSMDSLDASFIEQSKELRLTPAESLRAEQSLRAFMDAHPIDMAAAVAKNESFDLGSKVRAFFTLRSAPALAAIVVLVGSGAGISYAAESAVPGDALYAVKIHVNEPVAAALAFTPEAKAAVNAKIASSRVQEAETLAAEGRLTNDTSAALISDFDKHVAMAQTNIEEVQTNGNDGAAVSLHASMKGELRHHADILRRLADQNGDGNDHGDVAAILNHVEGASDAVVAAAASTGMQIAARDGHDEGGDRSSARSDGENGNHGPFGIAAMRVNPGDHGPEPSDESGSSSHDDHPIVGLPGLPHVASSLSKHGDDREGDDRKKHSSVSTSASGSTSVQANDEESSKTSGSGAQSDDEEHGDDGALNGIPLPKLFH